MERLTSASLVYLATPYTNYPGGIELAFRAAARLTAKLILAGVSAYSPIVQTHPVAIHGSLDPLDHAFWLRFDEIMMMKSDILLIGKLQTWEKSAGIAQERKYFSAVAKPIFTVDPDTLEVAAI